MTPPPPAAAVAAPPVRVRSRPEIHRPGRIPPSPARRPRRVSGPAGRPARAPTVSAPAVATRPLLDRLIHGRAWIGIVAFALIGIVTMQLGLLKLNAGIGRALEHEAALQRENSALSVEDSEVAAGDSIELQAVHMGMQLTPPGSLRFLSAQGSPSATIARALATLNARASAQGGEMTAGSASGAGESESSGSSPSGAGESSTPQAGSPGASGEATQAASTPGVSSQGASTSSQGTSSSEAGAQGTSATSTEASAGTSPSGETGSSRTGASAPSPSGAPAGEAGGAQSGAQASPQG